MKYFTTVLMWLITWAGLSQPSKERVILFPDRNMYISGEPIQFSAFIKPENDSATVSRILYCELITSAGRRMAGGKYVAENSIASGNLAIPPDLISGVYYLKAYTKAMRNEGPSVYSYDYIKVINPFKSEVHYSKKNESDPGPNYDAFEETISSLIKVPSSALPGELTRIIFEDPSACRTYKNLTVSVVPEHTISDMLISPPDEAVIDYYSLPETQGITITGIVKDKSANEVIPGLRVNLSITGSGRDFMPATTGHDGRFVFSVPYYTGNRDIFLCTESTDSLDPEIFVDNDFCNLPVYLPEEEFELSDSERVTALGMAARFRMGMYFNDDSIKPEVSTPVETPVFYGKPDETLVMDEYVQLPTLEEYFNQLPVPVKVRKRSGQKYFKMLGTQAELLEFDPLVMVDLVVIDDPEKILALDPRNISRIDIANSLYIKAGLIYGGVVNIISKEGDFAGISLPSSGVFLNYSFLSKPVNSQKQTEINSRRPDTRNTVFWEVLTNENDCSEISFWAPATTGKYQVVVRGVDEKGNLVNGSWILTVHNRK